MLMIRAPIGRGGLSLNQLPHHSSVHEASLLGREPHALHHAASPTPAPARASARAPLWPLDEVVLEQVGAQEQGLHNEE